MPTYCDKCSEVIDRPEELTRIEGDDLCLDCVPEPYGDFVRHVESTSQTIYDNLPNPCEIGSVISRLVFDESLSAQRHEDVMDRARTMLNDHLEMFHNIMCAANKLAGKEND